MFLRFLKNRRRVASLLILLAGLITSALLVLAGGGGGSNSLFTILNRGGTVPSNLQFKTASLSQTGDGGTQASATSSDNLTEKIVQAYGAQILSMNQQGAGQISKDSPAVVPNENAFATILSQQIGNGISIPTFGPTDIRISKTDDHGAAFNYLQSVQNAYQNDLSNVRINFFTALADFVDNNRTEPLQKNISAIATLLPHLLSIAVPPSWQDFHLQMLNLWQKRLTLASVILNSTDDPVKTLVAVQALSDGLSSEKDLLSRLRMTLKQQGFASPNS